MDKVKTLLDGLLSYDTDTGDMCWLVSRSNRIKAGVPIRQPKSHNNYIQVRVGGKLLLAHRLGWESVNGPIPDGLEINHINGKKDDNRLSNLELVTHKENLRHAKRTGLTPRVTTEEKAVVGVHKESGHGLYFRSLKEARRFGFCNVRSSIINENRYDKGYKWEYL